MQRRLLQRPLRVVLHPFLLCRPILRRVRRPHGPLRVRQAALGRCLLPARGAPLPARAAARRRRAHLCAVLPGAAVQGVCPGAGRGRCRRGGHAGGLWRRAAPGVVRRRPEAPPQGGVLQDLWPRGGAHRHARRPPALGQGGGCRQGEPLLHGARRLGARRAHARLQPARAARHFDRQALPEARRLALRRLWPRHERERQGGGYGSGPGRGLYPRRRGGLGVCHRHGGVGLPGAVPRAAGAGRRGELGPARRCGVCGVLGVGRGLVFGWRPAGEGAGESWLAGWLASSRWASQAAVQPASKPGAARSPAQRSQPRGPSPEVPAQPPN